MTKTTSKLAEVLVHLGILPEGTEIVVQRLHHGFWQRSAGAWSWSAYRTDSPNQADIAGSTDPVGLILFAYGRSPDNVTYAYHSFPPELYADNESCQLWTEKKEKAKIAADIKQRARQAEADTAIESRRQERATSDPEYAAFLNRLAEAKKRAFGGEE